MKKLLVLLVISLIAVPCFAGVDVDGSVSYVNTNNKTFGANLASFSITTWVKTTDTNADQVFSGTFNTGTTTGLNFFNNSNGTGKVSVFVRDEAGKVFQEEANADTGITDGNPHHVAIVVNPEAANGLIYIDGNLVASSVTQDTSPTDNYVNFDWDLWIGTANNRGSIINSMDAEFIDFKVWDIELTASQVEQLADSKLKRIAIQIAPSNRFLDYAFDDESDGSNADADTFLDLAGTSNATGVANGGTITAKAETVLTY